MITAIDPATVIITEVTKDAFTVQVKIDDEWHYHQGPKDYAFFTYDEAIAFAYKVRERRTVNTMYWLHSSTPWSELEEGWMRQSQED